MAPTMPKKKSKGRSKQEKRKLKEIAEVPEEDRLPGAVYVGHVPHGFYERQLNEYFSQFGKVMELKLSRSKKTGNSKGYAFVKFRYAAVAKTVAETCHNYLFFNKLLKCEYKPMSELHPDTFFRYHMTRNLRPKRLHNRPQTESEMVESFDGMVKKQKTKLERLQARGLKVDLEDVLEIKNNGLDLNTKNDTKQPESEDPTPEAPATTQRASLKTGKAKAVRSPPKLSAAPPKASLKRKAAEAESEDPSPSKTKPARTAKRAKVSHSPGDLQPDKTISPKPKQTASPAGNTTKKGSETNISGPVKTKATPVKKNKRTTPRKAKK